ncbi:MAG: ABC transporter substrate-binding protein [Daejeonella sp.]
MIRDNPLKIDLQLFLVLAATLLFSIFPFVSLKSEERKTLTLQLKWHHQFQFAGYYAAFQKGFYEEAGFNVQVLEGGTAHPPVEAVLSGKADFGVTGSDIINFHIEKAPVVIISAIFQNSPYVFMTMSEKKINSAADLAGKRIMVSRDQGWLLLRALFLREGISINNIQLFEHSWNIQDLISGKVDAISAYSTVEPQKMRRKGYAVSLIRPIDYGIDFYGDVLFTTRAMSNEHPLTVEKFNEASLKGWEYAMAHPEEIADLILNLPGVRERGVTREDLLDEAAEMRKLILPELVEIGHINPGRWQNMLNIYKQLGIADKDASIEGFIFQSASTRKIAYFNILLYLLAIGGFLFMAALVVNWQLRKRVYKKTIDLQNEIQIRKSAEQRLELAIEATGLGIWEWDLQANRTTYDDKWIQSLGYEPARFMKDLVWMDIVHPDDEASVREILRGLVEGKIPYNSLAYRIKTAQGQWKWILSFCKITKLQENGKTLNVIGTHLDIDFIKGKEIELQEITRELRKTNTELEKFAYITSHNLRAPVVNLMSLTEMQTQEVLPDELNREITQKIHYCVKQLDSTLNDLVEIVATKSGNHVNKEHMDLQTELDVILRSIEKQVIESGARIETNFSEIKSIYFPKRFLHSILLNLLTNAIKYRSEKRELIISVNTYVKKDHTILYFSDNGLGMNMNKFGNKIFGLYQRFHSKIDGKGLGLYIIKSQIESMDGKIEVQSTPDVGTTFKISFTNGVTS